MDEVETFVVNREDGTLQRVNSEDENNNEQPRLVLAAMTSYYRKSYYASTTAFFFSTAKWSPEKFTQHVMDIVFGKSDSRNTGLREVGKVNF